MNIPELLKSHLKQPVAIFGFGISGRAVAKVLEKLEVSHSVYDNKQEDDAEISNISNIFTTKEAVKHDLIVYSPSFAINHPWLKLAKKSGCLCLGELDFSALFWTGKIIAITGTNGKSTLTTLLGKALKDQGLNALVCGNIGSPLSAQYPHFDDPEAIAVCEVSSFQSETIRYFSPDTVLWTSFDEDHLDRHADMRSYFEAKWKLVKRLKTRQLYISKAVEEAINSYGYELPYGTVVISADQDQHQELELPPSGIFSTMPQAENYLLGLAYWKTQKLDVEIFRQVGINFEPLPHRLSQFAEIEGIGFWNDAKGTNFSATIAALKSFGEKVLWIGGGKMKGGDQCRFVDTISPYIEEAFLIGEAADILEKRFIELNLKVKKFFSLEEAIDAAFNKAKLLGEKPHIVFSPGYASFDMFKNAEERGKSFEKKVLELKTEQKTLEVV